MILFWHQRNDNETLPSDLEKLAAIKEDLAKHCLPGRDPAR